MKLSSVMRNDKNLPDFDSVCKEYLKLVSEDFDDSEKSRPFCYNERALVSILAGSIWKTGGFAFEEYSTKRWNGVEVRNARADLWARINQTEYCLEAKTCILSISSPQKTVSEFFKELLDIAVDEANRLQEDYQKVGCCIAKVLSPVAKSTENDIQELIKRICAFKLFDVGAYFFLDPGKDELPFVSVKRKHDYHCIGTVLLLRKA